MERVREKAEILDAEGIRRAITRIAHEIIEKNGGAENLIVVGILRRGVPIAQRLREKLQELEGVEVPVGSLNIAL